MQVLLVEDNARLAGLVGEALGREGFGHRSVGSTAAALAALAQFAPDIVHIATPDILGTP